MARKAKTAVKSAEKKTTELIKTAKKTTKKAAKTRVHPEKKIASKTEKNETVKKTSMAKKQNKTTSKKIYEETTPEKYFVLCDGRSIKNLKELALMMDEIEDHIFHHHVTHDRHDFSQWVYDVFKETDLAEQMRQASNRKDTQFVVFRHLVRKI
ncbi:hypothetical protein JW868_02585 [Candidatus Woesearchaeota archaeon]|nr:hypothetical protein [Candidatus Woesearchaeota archaeon]